MVSSSHEAMHRIFQEDPGVFARTFRDLGLPFREPAAVSLLPTDLTEIRPLERRLDTLLRFDLATGESFLLAVEAQGKKDPDKHASWAYYLAHLYAKYKLPPVLLVVCQDQRTAAWAEAPARIGPPEWPALTLRPLVLGPHNVPAITDPARAAQDIPLATLSAMTHGKDPHADEILRALASALKTLDEDTASIFIEITELGLGSTRAAQTWRNLMAVDLSFFRSETSQRLRAEGRAEGHAEGHAEGRAEGHAEGRAQDILLLLERRGIDVPDEARQRIATCRDLDTLGSWFTRAVAATSADELFAEDS
ncbi:hypothetical protein [Streptomyces sp. JJ36]|uniref:hypothetical protein n=1 Tax=Streptomyces sp. JJ36 TaxID=2736645 RepID=UPI001F2B57FE|nr:hypothetical protein [Streptomyces sp. JJ36]MCF6523523.1 hypothetical protein [Streptomyces sp. JJ36]